MPKFVSREFQTVEEPRTNVLRLPVIELRAPVFRVTTTNGRGRRSGR
jgi:hypothetical protein